MEEVDNVTELSISTELLVHRHTVVVTNGSLAFFVTVVSTLI